jgi:hypothetical protein
MIRRALCSLLGLVPASGQAAQPLRLVSAERHEAWVKFLPDGLLQYLKVSPRDIVFYSEEEMPRVYQDWSGLLPGIHDAYYNISAAKPQEPFGNPNREAPWNTGGTDHSDNADSIKFLVLPKTHGLQTVGVVPLLRLSRSLLTHDTVSPGTVQWTYRKGTVFGEIGLVRDPETAIEYPFHVRLLKKQSDDPFDWEFDELRPIVNRDDYFAVAGWHGSEAVRATFSDRHGVFNNEAIVEYLPAIDREVVRRLLRRRFTSARGRVWVRGESGLPGYAPSTKADFGIVPRNYDGAFIEISRESCMRCHQTTLMHANDFEPGRDWYGRVRGSDGVFSFHPFDPGYVSHGGFRVDPRIREALREYIE